MTKKTAAIMLFIVFPAFISAGSSGSDEPIGREDVLQRATTSGIEERGDSLIVARAEVGEESLPVVATETQIPAIIETEEGRLGIIMEKIFTVISTIYGNSLDNYGTHPSLIQKLVKTVGFLQKASNLLDDLNENSQFINFVRIKSDPEDPQIFTLEGEKCSCSPESAGKIPGNRQYDKNKKVDALRIKKAGDKKEIPVYYKVGKVIKDIEERRAYTTRSFRLARNTKEQEGDFTLLFKKVSHTFNKQEHEDFNLDIAYRLNKLRDIITLGLVLEIINPDAADTPTGRINEEQLIKSLKDFCKDNFSDCFRFTYTDLRVLDFFDKLEDDTKTAEEIQEIKEKAKLYFTDHLHALQMSFMTGSDPKLVVIVR